MRRLTRHFRRGFGKNDESRGREGQKEIQPEGIVTTEKRKPPAKPGASMNRSNSRSDVGAVMQHDMPGARRRSRQLDGERDLTVIAKHAQLHGGSLFVALRGELLA